MKYLERTITKKLMDYVRQFPVVFLTGPRQSGKSTLLKHVLPDYKYANLEEHDTREFAIEDPRGFLNNLGSHAIIDEAQRAPELFSYIQTFVDDKDESGMYILSGSQNFLLLKKISQSLAGRVGILSLLPFSFDELTGTGLISDNVNERILDGFYPRLITQKMTPTDFYPNYISTYVDRDVRDEAGVHDLNRFNSFMRICAQGVGTPTNMTSIGNLVAADARTVSSWLNILEESYITFRLRPYTRKVIPRYSKKSKLYFYDTGLLSNLLQINNSSELATHNLRGMLFENMIISEYYKQMHNIGGFPGNNTYFWRDGSNRDKEVDLIVEGSSDLKLYEIKSSETAKNKFADNLFLFEKHAEGINCEKNVIYNGPNTFTKNKINYKNLDSDLFG
jgi:predicted AAA+ superfamily ATPase